MQDLNSIMLAILEYFVSSKALIILYRFVIRVVSSDAQSVDCFGLRLVSNGASHIPAMLGHEHDFSFSSLYVEISF